MANIKELREERLTKIQDMISLGFKAFVNKVERTHKVGDVLDDDQTFQGKTITLAGRIHSVRLMGGINFIDLKDDSGSIQLLIKKGDLSSNPDENSFDTVQLKYLDSGDYIEAVGVVGTSKTGELSLMCTRVRLLAKAVRSMPDTHEGLKNIETRYRQRYVDLYLNETTRQVIKTRVMVARVVRDFLESEGFIEIETPVLQPLYGGASARPFTTYHHKLETELFLRIADELYLKRAIMAGFEKVYEIGHDFRNEGIDPAHNPEFTMLEFYWAYADYHDLMDLTEKLLQKVCQEVMGTTTITYKGEELNFTAPLKRITFSQAIKDQTGEDIDGIDREGMIELIKKHSVDVDLVSNPPLKDLIDAFFKVTTRPKLIGPLFLTEYPAVMKPLAMPSADDPTKSASMQLVVCGEEILNAYNELNDPRIQLANWQAEQRVLDAGESDEAQPIDYDYIRALEYGMPPTAGWGMGIDRLVQILTDQPSVKDTILFPTLRPEEFDESEFTYPEHNL